MASLKKSQRALIAVLALIVIVLCATAVIAMRNSRTGIYSTKAASSITACISDQFLCDSLSLLNKSGFLDQIYGGTISSFDGSTKTIKTWSQDSLGNNELSFSQNGVETDTTIRTPTEQYRKDPVSGIWSKVVSEESNTLPLIDQMGIEEDIGHFFGEDPNLSNYTFEKIGTSSCDGESCIEYQAHDKLLSDDSNKEYLFFDVLNYHLLKYQKISYDYESEYTFNYGNPPAISLPTVMP